MKSTIILTEISSKTMRIRRLLNKVQYKHMRSFLNMKGNPFNFRLDSNLAGQPRRIIKTILHHHILLALLNRLQLRQLLVILLAQPHRTSPAATGKSTLKLQWHSASLQIRGKLSVLRKAEGELLLPNSNAYLHHLGLGLRS